MDSEIKDKLRAFNEDIANKWEKYDLDIKQLDIGRFTAVPIISAVHTKFILEKEISTEMVEFFNKIYDVVLNSAIEYNKLLKSTKGKINGHSALEVTNRIALNISPFSIYNYSTKIPLKKGKKIKKIENYTIQNPDIPTRQFTKYVNAGETILSSFPVLIDKNEMISRFSQYQCYLSIVGSSNLDMSVWGKKKSDNNEISEKNVQKAMEEIVEVSMKTGAQALEEERQRQMGNYVPETYDINKTESDEKTKQAISIAMKKILDRVGESDVEKILSEGFIQKIQKIGDLNSIIKNELQEIWEDLYEDMIESNKILINLQTQTFSDLNSRIDIFREKTQQQEIYDKDIKNIAEGINTLNANVSEKIKFLENLQNDFTNLSGQEIDKISDEVGILSADTTKLKDDIIKFDKKLSDDIDEYERNAIKVLKKRLEEKINKKLSELKIYLDELSSMVTYSPEYLPEYNKIDIESINSLGDTIVQDYNKLLNFDYSLITSIDNYEKYNSFVRGIKYKKEFKTQQEKFQREDAESKKAYADFLEVVKKAKGPLTDRAKAILCSIDKIGNEDKNTNKEVSNIKIQIEKIQKDIDKLSTQEDVNNIENRLDTIEKEVNEIDEYYTNTVLPLLQQRKDNAEMLAKALFDNLRQVYINSILINTVLNHISKSKQSLRNLNPVFEKATTLGWVGKCGSGEANRLQTYKSKNNVKSLIDCSTTLDPLQIDSLSKRVKNDYEMLRGPVRIYLILAPYRPSANEDKNAPIFSKVNNSIIDVNPPCFKEFEYEKHKDLYNLVETKSMIYVSPKGKKSLFYSNKYDIGQKYIDDSVPQFSRIYTPVSKDDPNRPVTLYSDSAKDIFRDNIEETIDNSLGVSDTIFMAYGPSGSGKTYNLIGDDNVLDKGGNINISDPKTFGKLGIIFHAMSYLIKTKKQKRITKIEVSSKQYYTRCATTSTSTNYDSLHYYKQLDPNFENNYIYGGNDVVKFINDYNNNPKVNQEEDKFIYRYSHLYGENIDPKGYGVNELNELYHEFTQKESSPSAPKFRHFLDNKFGIVDGVKYYIKLNFDSLNGSEWFKKASPGEFMRWFIDPNFFTSTEYIHIDDDPDLIPWKDTGAGGKGEVSRDKIPSFFFNTLRGSMQSYYDDYIKSKKAGKAFKKYVESLDPDMGVRANVFSGGRLGVQGDVRKISEAGYYFKVIETLVNYGRLYHSKFTRMTQDSDSEYKVTLFESNKDMDSIGILKRYYRSIKRSRPTRSTPLNIESSRSHLTIKIKVISKGVENENIPTNYTFVDLAGNEKADENLFTMREEGNGIMASLIAIKSLLEAKQLLTANDFSNLRLADFKKYSTEDYYSLTGKKKVACVRDAFGSVWEKFFKFFKESSKSGNDSSISMYLNLPTYMFGDPKKGSNKNRCLAIGDSLAFVDGLMKNTQISNYLPDLDYIDKLKKQAEEIYPEPKSSFGNRRVKRRRRV